MNITMLLRQLILTLQVCVNMLEPKEHVQTAGEYVPDIINSVETISYEKSMVERAFSRLKGAMVLIT